jgi:hypothetical protein
MKTTIKHNSERKETKKKKLPGLYLLVVVLNFDFSPLQEGTKMWEQ